MMKLIQNNAPTTPSNGSATISLGKATLARSLIIILVVEDTSETVTSVTDNAPSGSSLYLTTGQKVSNFNGTDNLEAWYAPNTNAGATSITVATNGTLALLPFMLEVQVMNSETPFHVGAIQPSGASTSTPVGPSVTTTDSLCFIANILDTVNATVNSVNAPWTLLNNISGLCDSFMITTYQGVGTYAPTYNLSIPNTFASITVSFREAPHSTDIRAGVQILAPSQIGIGTIASDYYEG